MLLLVPHLVHVSGAGEEVSVLVEGDGHDPVCEVEGLLHAVPVVDVDIDVQHPGVVLQVVLALPGVVLVVLQVILQVVLEVLQVVLQ